MEANARRRLQSDMYKYVCSNYGVPNNPCKGCPYTSWECRKPMDVLDEFALHQLVLRVTMEQKRRKQVDA